MFIPNSLSIKHWRTLWIFILVVGLMGNLSCTPSESGVPGETTSEVSQNESSSSECPDGFRDAQGECLEQCINGQCAHGYWCHWETGFCLPDSLGNSSDEEAETESGSPCSESPAGTDTDSQPETDPNPQSPQPSDDDETQSSPSQECESFMDCEFGENCEEGQCVAIDFELVTTCEENADCGLLMTCQLGVCVGCLDDLQCPDGECIYGLCVSDDLGPGIGCIDADCPDSQRCDWTTGLCQPTCSSDGDCLEDEFCSVITQFCEPEFRCDDSSECETALCVAGVCVGCETDEQCALGTQCILGACLPNPLGYNACDDAQCNPDSELCDPRDGTCYAADGSCQDSEDCPEDLSCNGIFNVCTGCSQDSECRPQQRCLLSACVAL